MIDPSNYCVGKIDKLSARVILSGFPKKATLSEYPRMYCPKNKIREDPEEFHVTLAPGDTQQTKPGTAKYLETYSIDLGDSADPITKDSVYILEIPKSKY